MSGLDILLPLQAAVRSRVQAASINSAQLGDDLKREMTTVGADCATLREETRFGGGGQLQGPGI